MMPKSTWRSNSSILRSRRASGLRGAGFWRAARSARLRTFSWWRLAWRAWCRRRSPTSPLFSYSLNLRRNSRYKGGIWGALRSVVRPLRSSSSWREFRRVAILKIWWRISRLTLWMAWVGNKTPTDCSRVRWLPRRGWECSPRRTKPCFPQKILWILRISRKQIKNIRKKRVTVSTI